MDSCMSTLFLFLYIYKFCNSNKYHSGTFIAERPNSYKLYLEEQYGQCLQEDKAEIKTKTLKIYDSKDLEGGLEEQRR